jgi:serine phosphatase RsbU (regulator of sigma subunit)
MSPENRENVDFIPLLQNQDIDEHLASLRYAYMIQNALMPDHEFLKGLLSDFFIFFLPRDIISGDFYYAFCNRQYVCVAAGDCTGHGVPGALLSILGISFLNEILQSKVNLKANRILNMMREKVMKALHQTGTHSETKDSIDIGLCIIEKSAGILQFSGANRPLIMTRGGLLTEFKPDKMTIGIAPHTEQPFNNRVIEIKPGDSFYLFSDGFADQIGELSDKRFKYKQFKQILESVTGLSMANQKECLEFSFNEWKGNTQQVDDVLVFGFQI